MIAALQGKLLDKNADRLIVDVSGVGYEVTVSASVFSNLGKVGDAVSLIVYTDVKENSISLFGFTNSSERELFLLLKKVKGVGSRLALTIISSLTAPELLSSIGSGDISSLKRIPGVGKKTAERLVVELREHVGAIANEQGVANLVIEKKKLSQKDQLSEFGTSAAQDVVLALEKLGFSTDRAKNVVSTTLQSLGSDSKVSQDPGELLKASLSNI